jgi:hypothetical protein
MDTVLELINQAAGSGDWLVLAIAAVCLIVPIVLKALGKSVPIVDQIVSVVIGVAKSLRKPKPPAPLEPGKEGIAAVVEVKDETK